VANSAPLSALQRVRETLKLSGSERHLRATGGGKALALVAHHRAFAGDEQTDICGQPIFHACAEHAADRARLPRRHERVLRRAQRAKAPEIIDKPLIRSAAARST